MFRPGKPKEPTPTTTGGPIPNQPQPTTPPPPPPAPTMASTPSEAPPRMTEQPSSTGARSTTNDQNNARAYSESDSLARDIKEGTLSGFVGNGTALT
ncbi:MAG: hypothetical protein H0T45_14530, partial [Pyrinomonadaceae bacterium]|nr:hypothetical protein [Pyrinomonadaceae bacterium]